MYTLGRASATMYHSFARYFQLPSPRSEVQPTHGLCIFVACTNKAYYIVPAHIFSYALPGDTPEVHDTCMHSVYAWFTHVSICCRNVYVPGGFAHHPGYRNCMGTTWNVLQTQHDPRGGGLQQVPLFYGSTT